MYQIKMITNLTLNLQVTECIVATFSSKISNICKPLNFEMFNLFSPSMAFVHHISKFHNYKNIFLDAWASPRLTFFLYFQNY